jgi:hypothetical protein
MANLLSTTVNGSVLVGPSGTAHAYDGAATGKLYFGNQVSDSPTHYHITTNMENVGGNYSKLDIRWYTGQRFYAHQGYGGFRFKEITTGNDLFSIGYTDGHVRVENNLYVGNTIYNNGNAVIHAGNIGSQSVNYAASAGNADTLDGYHASSFTYVPTWTSNTQSASRSNFVSTGNWYRIANLGTERFFARVRIYDDSSGGPHASVEFQVAGAFNASGGYSFNLTSNGYYSAPSVTQVRILSKGTYDPQYLEVYIGYVGYVPATFAVSLLEARNASVVNWDAGSIPDGYSATTWDANAPLAVGGRPAIFNSGIYNTSDYSRLGNVLVGQGTYKNTIKPIDDANLNIQTPSGAVYFDTYGQATGSFRAPIFYDSDDTGFYVDPNGTSNLRKFSEFTMAYNGMNPRSANSPYVDRYNGSAGYRNGTMGFANTDFNVIARNWGSGFIDTWSSPANAPGSSSHYIGLQGVHYSDGGTSFYGFQMACAGEADNRFFWRSSWPNMRSWVEMIHSGNIASQSVSYADESGYSASSGSVEWTSVQNKPSTFPPSTHNHDDRYYTESESDGRYVPYGSITGSFGLNDNKLYLRTNGDNNHYIWNADDDWEELVYYNGTGFRVKGATGTVPAYFTEAGVYASAYRGKDNVGGTGTASWHPDGAYIGGTMWQYGDMYKNNSPIYNVGYLGISGPNTTPIDITGASHKYITINPGNGYEAMVRYIGGSGSSWYVGKRTSSQLVGTQSFHFYSEEAGATVGGITPGGDMHASGSMRAPIFYDSNNTDYYLDPNASTSLKIAGLIETTRSNGTMLSHGSMADAIGWNGDYGTYIGSTVGGTSYLYANGTFYTGGAFRTLIHSGNIGSQSVNYATSAGNADTVDSLHASSFVRSDQNAVTIQRHLDASTTWTNDALTLFLGWYSGKLVVGNNNEGNHDNASALGGNTIAITNTLYSFEQSNLYYDGSLKLYMGTDGTRNTGWAYHTNNGTGLHWPNNGWHIYPVNASDMYIRSGASDCSLKFTKSGESGSYVHCSADNDIGFLTTGRSWSLRVDNSGNAFATSSFRAPIFYDSNDTGYYLDPNGTSNLLQLNTSTRARWNMPRIWYDRSSRTSDEGYWTGTNGWATADGTWAGAWQGGFSGWDIWGTGTDHPQGGDYVHAQGIVSGQHYATSSVGYGWMMVGAHNATVNRYWLRGKWDTSTSGWTEMMTSNQNPIAWNMDQYVRTSDSVSFNSTTSPTFLVNNQSDNTKGYRIYNTSNASVSAMFTNSANALVIGAGAFDQVQLNKKVLVSGAALGVNVAASATAGRIDASNDIVAYSSSDERLKHNITPIENALDKVKSLTGVEFDWKPEYKHAHGYEGHDTGIIAQQVQEVIPSAVRTNDTGFLAVRYEKLIGLLVEGMKEQQAQIEELKAKLDGLTK